MVKPENVEIIPAKSKLSLLSIPKLAPKILERYDETGVKLVFLERI